MSFDLFGIISSDVIVSAIKNGILGRVEMFVDVRFVSNKFKPLELLRTHSGIYINSERSDEEVFRRLAYRGRHDILDRN